jgi:superkiller protein 3
LRKVAGEADTAMREQDWETAITKLDEMAKLQPNNATVFYHQAIALTNMKKFDEADATIDKAISIDPNEEAFKNIKGQIAKRKEAFAIEKAKIAVVMIQGLNTKEMYDQALTKIESSREIMTKELEPVLWEEKAKAHLGLEQIDKALEAFQKAFELVDKPVADSLYEMAQGFNRKGKQSEALQIYEFILKIEPSFPEVYYELGMEYFYGASPDKVKAKEMLEKYLEIGKDDAHKSNASNVLAVMAKG